MAKLNLNGQEALNELKKVIQEVENLKRASKNMSQTSVENFSKLENAVSNLRSKISDVGNRMNYLEAILKKNSNALNQNTTATKNNTTATNQNSKAQAMQNSQFKSAVPTLKQLVAFKKQDTKATNNLKKATQGLTSVTKGLLATFGIVAGIQIFKDILKDVYNTTKQFDSFTFALNKITGSAENAADSERFLMDITEKYGVELVKTTNRWIKFLAAAKESGLALRETENIFRSMTKAAGVLGLNTEELQGVYLALEQMLSKGKVTTEELRRQLGERLPGAMGIMAAAVGVTIPKLDEMLKKGEVLSAEVLPKFAKALELAYDIENVNRIDTITAAQNRLTAAWQRFVKNVSANDSVLRKIFGGLLNLFTEVIEDWDRLLRGDDADLQERIKNKTNQLEKELDSSFANQLSLEQGFLNKREQLQKEASAAKKAIDDAIGKEEKDAATNRYDEALRQLTEFEEQKTALLKQYALENAKQAQQEYKDDLKARRDFLNKVTSFEQSKGKAGPFQEGIGNFGIFGDKEYLGVTIKSVEDINSVMEQLTSNVVASTAKWYIFKKLIEESSVQVPPDEEGVGKTQRRLRRIKDYWLETLIEMKKANEDYNNNIANDERNNLEVRVDAMREAANSRIYIAETEYAIAERDSKARLESELESIRESVNKGTLARAKAIKREKELEDERNAYLLLERTKLTNKLAALEFDLSQQLYKLTTNTLEGRAIDGVENIYDKQIIALKKTYNESAKTAKDYEELQRGMAQVTIDATNAIIDKKIELIKAEIVSLKLLGGATDEYIDSLLNEIDRLESEKLVTPPDNVKDWRDYFGQIIDLAKQFNDAFAEIADNIYERRIQNIEAEIRQTEDKYDTLINLAEGDDEQQATLERNKEARIRKLERERIREERKQAKARKAFAIADININTAKGIVGIWSEWGAYPAVAAAFTAIFAALAAVQTAAVISEPIPQYKEGLDKALSDHKGMINDGDYQEYVERNGRILTSTKKNAIVDLKKGDTVYKNYEDMVSRSALFRIKNTKANLILNEDKLGGLITSSIDKGFKRVRINNNVSVNNHVSTSDYKESLSKWN